MPPEKDGGRGDSPKLKDPDINTVPGRFAKKMTSEFVGLVKILLRYHHPTLGTYTLALDLLSRLKMSLMHVPTLNRL